MRELQFAKASIATGWALLVEELGVKVSDIQQVLLAGSFGTYLSPASAVRIGLVPKLAAAADRRRRQRRRRGREDDPALRAGARRSRGAACDEVEYVELSDRPDFNDLFIDQLAFPAVTVGVVACGALALHVQAIARRRGLDVDVHPLPPQLHNRPERIAPAVAGEARRARRAPRAGRGGLRRLRQLRRARRGARGHRHRAPGRRHVLRPASASTRCSEALAEEPGTYFLTDFLARTFEHTVWRSLGLDRYPELRDDYFRSYRRCIWLAQRPTPALRKAAEHAASLLGLPLTEVVVGEGGLERELVRICAAAAA